MSNQRNNMSMQQSLQARIMNCVAFITTGTCFYGKFCRYKHPKPAEVVADRQRGMYQSSPTPCKFFFAGFCKYGASCRFSHPLPVVPNLQLHFNSLGLPKRLDANTCSFYMLNGTCGFGVACKYDHPEPVNQYPHQGDGSYVAVEVEEHQNALDGNTYGWNGDENQYVQLPQPNFCYPSGSRVYPNEYHGVTNGGNGNGNQQEMQARNGVASKEPCVALSDAGLPLRPGKRVCRLYESLGLCKYGRRCKFDHPLARSSNEEGSSKPISSGETPNAQE